jgi:hypothetical protein
MEVDGERSRADAEAAALAAHPCEHCA